MQIAEQVQINPEGEMAEEQQRLARLLEAGRIEEARSLAPVLAARWPESRSLQRLARVLAPPRILATGGKPGRSLEAEHNWLRQHAREYPGCWIAVYQDRLIAAGPLLRDVLQSATDTVGDEDAVLFFQPER